MQSLGLAQKIATLIPPYEDSRSRAFLLRVFGELDEYNHGFDIARIL